MKITLDITDDRIDSFLKELMENLPEACTSMTCVKWKYDACEFDIWDEDRSTERPEKYRLDLPKLRIGFQKMMHDLLEEKKISFPGLDSESFMDGGQWDGGSIDALVQYSLLGELVYS